MPRGPRTIGSSWSGLKRCDVTMFDDGRRTATARAQHALEKQLVPIHEAFLDATAEERLQKLTLKRDIHIAYLQQHLGPLPEHFTALDASQPWIVYWILHSLAMLDAPADTDAVIELLKECQVETGGFGGGPHQLPHLASTYAAVMSLVTIGTPEALNIIDRDKLQNYLLRMCVSPEQGGGLRVHENGEIDVRGCYTAIAVAHVLNLNKSQIAERSGIVDYVKRCQSFEGGLGGEPGNEAHGGYTFCGLATLCLLNRVDVLNIPSLLRWVVHMQGSVEGGFMGRTHKLVDGCYSYWQGAIFSLLKDYTTADQRSLLIPTSIPIDNTIANLPMYEPASESYSAHDDAKTQGERKLKDRAKELGLDFKQAIDSLLQKEITAEEYDQRLRLTLFRATFEECQDTLRAINASFGHMFPQGSASRRTLPLIEATASSRDEEHQLFDAVGLQFWVMIHSQVDTGGLRDKPRKPPDLYHTCYCLSGLAAAQQYSGIVLGPEENRLKQIDPVLNVVRDKGEAALRYFNDMA